MLKNLFFFLIEKAKLSLLLKKYEKSIFTRCLKVSQGVLKSFKVTKSMIKIIIKGPKQQRILGMAY